MKLKSELSFLFLISFGIFVSGQKSAGDSCIAERTQQNGICKSILECPSIINDIRNRKRYTRCGFQGRTEIVCCPAPRATTTTTPPPVITSDSRISVRKCEEYKSAVFTYTSYLDLAGGSKPTQIKLDKCGHTVIPLIVGGEFAKPREFPHMALLGMDNGNGQPMWTCGGALISDEFILTAGHCLYLRQFGDVKFVLLGDLNIASNTDDALPETYIVKEIIPHPQYTRNSKYYDIALLRLDRKVQLDPYKRPACLPTTFEGPEKKTIASGWGQTAWAGNTSNHLQKVTLDKFDFNECNQSYADEINRKLRFGILPETQMCAGSRGEEKDTCQGDSGGPLQVYHPYNYCMYTVVGVTSFGIACATPGVPGVYTRIYPFLDWIENIVWSGNS